MTLDEGVTYALEPVEAVGQDTDVIGTCTG
jgi:hypothetical protein